MPAPRRPDPTGLELLGAPPTVVGCVGTLDYVPLERLNRPRTQIVLGHEKPPDLTVGESAAWDRMAAEITAHPEAELAHSVAADTPYM